MNRFNFIQHFQTNLTSVRSISANCDDTMQGNIALTIYRYIGLSAYLYLLRLLLPRIDLFYFECAQNWNIHVNHNEIRRFNFPCIVLSKQIPPDLASSLALPFIFASSAFGFVAVPPSSLYPVPSSLTSCAHCAEYAAEDWLSTRRRCWVSAEYPS